MFVPGTDYQVFSVGNALVKLSQLAAGPNFELQFAAAQDAVLDRMDKEIEKLENVKQLDGLTAHLELQRNALQRDVDRVEEYHERTKSNGINIDTLTTQLQEARTLAGPTTVAEFDAKLAEAIATMKKIQTRVPEPYGVRDGLRQVRDTALQEAESLDHLNFILPTKITEVQQWIDDTVAAFATPRSILTQNQTASFNLLDKNGDRISEITAEINAVKADAKAGQLEKIEEAQDRFGRILTILSLAFEGSQSIASFVADNTLLKPTKAAPGTILSLFA